MTKFPFLIIFLASSIGTSANLKANPINVTESPGGIRDVVPPSSTWSPIYINDGVTTAGDSRNWLSRHNNVSNNTFEFTFDRIQDGVTGEAGDANDIYQLSSISLYLPGSDRSLKEFTLEARNTSGTWQRLYSSQAVDNPYNFAKTVAGGIRSVIPASSTWSPIYINDGVTTAGDSRNWLSRHNNVSGNTFEFTFDPDLSGTAAEVVDQFTLDSISLYLPGSDRSLKNFEITVQTTAGWQAVIPLQANKASGQQVFNIGPYNNVLRVKLETISNYGNSYVQVNELAVNGVWAGDNPVFKAAKISGEQTFDLAAATVNNDGRRDSLTDLRFTTISNYGNSYVQVNELAVNGVWAGDNPVFKAAKISGEQAFDLAAATVNNDGRRDNITRLRLNTISNYGDSYVQVNEFQAFGIITETLTGGFNAFDTMTAAAAITGSLQTRVANNAAISFDVIALNTDKSAVDASFTKDVKVELLANMASVALDANNCPVTSTVIAALPVAAISNGRSTVTMPVTNNVWKEVYVQISYQPPVGTLIVTCSVDKFAIRPTAFTLVAQHGDWETSGNNQTINASTSTANPTHKAGRPFSLQLKAVDSAGTTMSNYEDIPVLTNNYPTLISPAGGILGALNLGTLSNSNGVISSATAYYPEVGIISLKMSDEDFAGVDAVDGTSLINRTISSAEIIIGRFIPDHFEASTVNNGSFDDTCTGFTYSGQLFTYQSAPELKVTAYNSASVITQNYTGLFAKLTQSDFSVTTPTSDAVRLQANNIDLVSLNWNPAASSLNDNADGSLNFTFGADSYNHLHDANSRIAPYTNTVKLSFTAITDSDGVTTQALPHVLQPTGGSVRFGRVAISNAHGSEITSLPVTIKIEYFSGIDWIENTADQCTTLILASQIQLSNSETGGGGWLSGNTTMTIASGSTAGTLTNNDPLTSGSAVLSLSAPGEDNQGYVNVRSQISGSYNWLLGNYNDNGIYDNEATARASFGLFKGSDTIIFRREIY
jgi:lambda repressor-like predicted transcriptional regulator